MKYIYALIDPRTRQIRYVGQSSDPERRYQQHINTVEDAPKGAWIQELRVMDQLPDFILIDECEDTEAFYLENWWILIGKRQGWPLTNGTNPGEWRAQEDFKQIFDAHLKAMEAEHKQALEKMETDAIRAARHDELIKWSNRLYWFPYTVITLANLFNAYAGIMKAGFYHDGVWSALPVSLGWLAFIMYAYLHNICRRANTWDWVVELVLWLVLIMSVTGSFDAMYTMGVMSK